MNISACLFAPIKISTLLEVKNLIKLVRALFMVLLLLDCNDAFSGGTVQMVYSGSMMATVRAPSKWHYEPATKEQEQSGMLAIYSPDIKDNNLAYIYLSILPKEKRKPDILSKEIEYDISQSRQDGLTLIKTLKSKNKQGKDIALNIWKGKGNKQYIGIFSNEDGVFYVMGISNSEHFDESVSKAVIDIMKNASYSNVYVPPSKRTK